MREQDEFIQLSEAAVANKELQRKVHHAVHQYEKAWNEGKNQFSNLELARERASYIRFKVIESLDKFLIDFEASLMRRGGKVLWANDAKAALDEIDQLVQKRNAQSIVKSKSMIGEEIGLNEYLRKKGIQVYETDLGEYIVDQAGERPFHGVTPAMHKSRAEIAELLNQKISSSLEADAAELSNDVREVIRPQYTRADIGITGANFLIADSGLVSITENEGNARLSSTFAKTHIVLASIEKIVPTVNDVELLMALLATYGTGQKLTAYNTIIGPKANDDIDGPSEFIVIIIDNGRSNLLAQPEQRQALACIKCGACHNVCPVFQQIGGHAYNTPYTGPIGSVVTPHLKGLDAYKHLSFASTLCGKCTDICPVKIDIHNHLLRNRRDAVHNGFAKNTEKLMWFSWKKIVLARKNMNKGTSIKQFMLNSFFKSAWGEQREFPKLAEKSFNQRWREQFGA
ncbi:MAG: lactate utilization protein [Bacteroidia bacterium]|jgi:L-lactate dehydrogenase complex protein LldF|nr:lactate utilization protein [Bacteroidia bacterium]